MHIFSIQQTTQMFSVFKTVPGGRRRVDVVDVLLFIAIVALGSSPLIPVNW